MADTNANGNAQQSGSKLKSVESLDQTNAMERGLSNRHVQFIAIGGTIGTGLFLGSGKSISLTGPSIVFVYILVGVIMFFLMRAIGEMMYRDPSQHTFINFITRYLGNGFGEVEFWFSMIKITLIGAMIVTAVVMIVIGYQYPAARIHGVDHVSPAGHAGLDNLFAGFSFAPNGWMAFLMSFQMVFFAYELLEFVGVTVSETKNPRKVLPKAINEIIVRVLIFYVGALVAIMCIVPWTSFKPNKDGSFASPFIMVFQYAGLNWASALVFFVVITAASSALNSLLYSAGRHLYQLAEESPSPMLNKIGQVSDRKVPARAILVSAVLILLSPIVNAIPGVSGAFVLFSSASSAVFLFIYILTLVAHRKYRRSDDFIPDGFVMPAWKVLNTVAIAFFVFIYLTLFLADDTRNSAIAGLVWLIGFGGFSLLRERYRSRDLKAALEHKE